MPSFTSKPGALHRTPAASGEDLSASWHTAAWQQVLARDRSADGSFVYAVRSTGIFCRPSCPSRRPDPSRVAFFRSAGEAREAGFRPCRRCRPEVDAAALTAADGAVVTAAIAHLDRTGDERVDLAALSASVGHPRATVLRAFRRTLGTTPARFARQRRLESFRRTLAPGQQPQSPARITDAIYDAGFSSSSRLYEQSDAALGMTPSALRAGAPGARILYTIADSPLGRTLVAATDVGVCAISFAGSDEDLLQELRSRFPKAHLIPAPPAPHGDTPGSKPDQWLAEAVNFVLSQLSEHPAAVRFPLDVRATAFQQRVWEALRRIPRGQTLSYAGLATQLGHPSGARAVAGACARNPVALAIPCHRIVSSNGALAGYRWGIERKRAILAAETGSEDTPASAESGSRPQPSPPRGV